MEAAANEPLPEIPDIKIYDLFPSFESMDSDDQVIEVSAIRYLYVPKGGVFAKAFITSIPAFSEHQG